MVSDLNFRTAANALSVARQVLTAYGAVPTLPPNAALARSPRPSLRQAQEALASASTSLDEAVASIPVNEDARMSPAPARQAAPVSPLPAHVTAEDSPAQTQPIQQSPQTRAAPPTPIVAPPDPPSSTGRYGVVPPPVLQVRPPEAKDESGWQQHRTAALAAAVSDLKAKLEALVAAFCTVRDSRGSESRVLAGAATDRVVAAMAQAGTKLLEAQAACRYSAESMTHPKTIVPLLREADSRVREAEEALESLLQDVGEPSRAHSERWAQAARSVAAALRPGSPLGTAEPTPSGRSDGAPGAHKTPLSARSGRSARSLRSRRPRSGLRSAASPEARRARSTDARARRALAAKLAADQRLLSQRLASTKLARFHRRQRDKGDPRTIHECATLEGPAAAAAALPQERRRPVELFSLHPQAAPSLIGKAAAWDATHAGRVREAKSKASALSRAVSSSALTDTNTGGLEHVSKDVSGVFRSGAMWASAGVRFSADAVSPSAASRGRDVWGRPRGRQRSVEDAKWASYSLSRARSCERGEMARQVGENGRLAMAQRSLRRVRSHLSRSAGPPGGGDDLRRALEEALQHMSPRHAVATRSPGPGTRPRAVSSPRAASRSRPLSRPPSMARPGAQRSSGQSTGETPKQLEGPAGAQGLAGSPPPVPPSSSMGSGAPCRRQLSQAPGIVQLREQWSQLSRSAAARKPATEGHGEAEARPSLSSLASASLDSLVGPRT